MMFSGRFVLTTYLWFSFVFEVFLNVSVVYFVHCCGQHLCFRLVVSCWVSFMFYLYNTWVWNGCWEKNMAHVSL